MLLTLVILVNSVLPPKEAGFGIFNTAAPQHPQEAWLKDPIAVKAEDTQVSCVKYILTYNEPIFGILHYILY